MLQAAAQPAAVSPQLEIGHPLLHNFSALDYNAHGSNYAATQAAQGLMYFANGDGLLEHDGASWRFFDLPGQLRMYDFAISDSGTIFVGGEQELGYLAPRAFCSDVKYSSRNAGTSPGYPPL